MRPILADFFLFAALGELVESQPVSTALDPQRITFLVFDFVGLHREVHQDLRRTLDRVLQPAAISANWVDCLNGSTVIAQERCAYPHREDVFLRLVKHLKSNEGALHRGCAGLVEPDWGGRGRITVMADEIEDMRTGTSWQFSDLLAHVVAHEVGHLFGKLGHSSVGLMSAQWSTASLRRMTQGGLALSTSEVRRLQNATRQRLEN